MSIPVRQYSTIFAYILKQTLKGNKHYPLVLMLEPLFRCNLSCAGCGKIDPHPVTARTIIYYKDPGGKPGFSPEPKKDAEGRDYLPIYASEEAQADRR